MLIVAACLCWGIDNNLTRKISGSDPSQIAMWKGLVAGFVNTALALGFGAKFPAVGVALGAAIIGFFGYGLSLVLFVRALRHLGTARTAAYFSTAPFTGAALSFALGEGRLDWAFCVAGILMLAGVCFTSPNGTNIGTFTRLGTNTFTITTNTTSTNTLPTILQANLTPTAISTHGWRIPTRTTPTSITITITNHYTLLKPP
jgi:EamA-like transporter family